MDSMYAKFVHSHVYPRSLSNSNDDHLERRELRDDHDLADDATSDHSWME